MRLERVKVPIAVKQRVPVANTEGGNQSRDHSNRFCKFDSVALWSARASASTLGDRNQQHRGYPAGLSPRL
jgi:hypothetical protein